MDRIISDYKAIMVRIYNTMRCAQGVIGRTFRRGASPSRGTRHSGARLPCWPTPARAPCSPVSSCRSPLEPCMPCAPIIHRPPRRVRCAAVIRRGGRCLWGVRGDEVPSSSLTWASPICQSTPSRVPHGVTIPGSPVRPCGVRARRGGGRTPLGCGGLGAYRRCRARRSR